MEKNIMTTSEI